MNLDEELKKLLENDLETLKAQLKVLNQRYMELEFHSKSTPITERLKEQVKIKGLQEDLTKRIEEAEAREGIVMHSEYLHIHNGGITLEVVKRKEEFTGFYDELVLRIGSKIYSQKLSGMEIVFEGKPALDELCDFFIKVKEDKSLELENTPKYVDGGINNPTESDYSSESEAEEKAYEKKYNPQEGDKEKVLKNVDENFKVDISDFTEEELLRVSVDYINQDGNDTEADYYLDPQFIYDNNLLHEGEGKE